MIWFNVTINFASDVHVTLADSVIFWYQWPKSTACKKTWHRYPSPCLQRADTMSTSAWLAAALRWCLGKKSGLTRVIHHIVKWLNSGTEIFVPKVVSPLCYWYITCKMLQIVVWMSYLDIHFIFPGENEF